MDENKILKQLADAMSRQTDVLEKALHTKAPATSGTFTELHGNGSLFGSVPVERDVISARVTPRGLMNVLPAIPSVYASPNFASITGYTAVSGSEPSAPCVDAPAGYMKGCLLTAQFGQILRDTQTIDIAQTALLNNRGDFTDLILHGDLVGDGGVFNPAGINSNGILNAVTKNEMTMAAANAILVGSVMTWTGNPAAAVGNGYIPFPGLTRQIATGQVDAISNTLCPALDSDVKDFGCDDVEGGGRDIVEYLQVLEYYLVTGNAERMGLGPISAVIAMRPELWFVLSEIWPCRYNTNRCANSLQNANGATQVVIDGKGNITDRDAMRRSRTIDINGRTYPVVVDDGIPEDNVTTKGCLKAGEFSSSIFFIPTKIAGGFPVCYYEFLDYRQIGKEVENIKGKQMFWTDDGRFLWAYEDTGGYCYKLKLRTNPRIVLRTPQLAGRIDNVKYVPLQHLRSTDPSNIYHKDGGVSTRPDATKYHVW